MNASAKFKGTMTVAELMTDDVISISNHATMAQAAEILVDNGIDGAPVIDEMGRCVGVLSSGDFVQYERDREALLAAGSLGFVHEVLRDRGSGPYHIESREPGEIEVHMTPAVQTITPESTIEQAARMMAEEGIHRLIILDESNRPIGIISSNDLLRAMTYPSSLG